MRSVAVCPDVQVSPGRAKEPGCRLPAGTGVLGGGAAPAGASAVADQGTLTPIDRRVCQVMP
jgi:hypothetical protein